MILAAFLAGAATMGLLVSALFFLRFWRDTQDGLFLGFAVAFLLLGAGQTILALADTPAEERAPIYVIRLVAFLLILYVIARKNLRSR